jgi:hypothetical protein
MTVIYNCHHDGLDYRITKFEDGNPTSSYLCSAEACECPAGVRPTCRHRQMLPEMIAANIVNTHLFMHWDVDRFICDFQGLIESAPVPEGLHDTAEGLPPVVEQTVQPTSWRRM